MSKPSLSSVREAEVAAKKETLQRAAQQLGTPIPDAKAERLATERVNRAMERNLRDGRL